MLNAPLSLDDFCRRNGLRFNDQELILEALTHRSFVNEQGSRTKGDAEALPKDNERLEFLGDAIVGFVAGELLFNTFQDLREGELTRLRAAIVRTEALASVASYCGIGEALRLGRGEAQNGGRERVRNLCGAFEAVVAALYLDQGIDTVRAWLTPHLRQRLQWVLKHASDKDPRTLLQERAQFHYNVTPTYRLIEMSGPEHKRDFTAEALIDSIVVGSGTGESKQKAYHAAAHDALTRIESGEFDRALAVFVTPKEGSHPPPPST